MRIAQVAPPFQSVPPEGYGGTERVIATLADALVEAGHDVTLFASGDSQTRAKLVPVFKRAVWRHKPPYTNFTPFVVVTIGRLLSQLQQFDVVHSHLDYLGFPLARTAPRPVVTTLHNRLDLPELAPIWDEFRDVPLVAISAAQRQAAPSANWVATIHNGITLSEYTFNPRPGSYLAFLGRISPDKGVDTAIRVAQRTRTPLRIAARMPLPFKEDAEAQRDWAYYEDEIVPQLERRGARARLIGVVSGKRKNAFLRNAAALLFPIRWPEPFGLVMVEALACGTPVIALRAGSVPEVLEHAVTGFICDSEDELVEAVGRIGEIDRARCRAEAERRFSPATMAQEYERVYAALGKRAAARAR